jgi:hypothetical protein
MAQFSVLAGILEVVPQHVLYAMSVQSIKRMDDRPRSTNDWSFRLALLS